MLYDLRGFNWLLAELDEKNETAFGWANLNDDENAEWGYMGLSELDSLGAAKDDNWIPLFFPEAKRLCYGYLEDPGTKEHFDWWRHQYHDFLKQEHNKVDSKLNFLRYVEHIYRMQFDLLT
jgi:hypothetical protein